MARGGAREGAGRKKGARNKRTKEQVDAVVASGETPLDYMLKVMRDPTVDEKRRDAMAASAAPYVHARLQSTTHKGDGEGGAINVQIVRFSDPPSSQ